MKLRYINNDMFYFFSFSLLLVLFFFWSLHLLTSQQRTGSEVALMQTLVREEEKKTA